jgi:ribosomal protein S18 acetylase RimI-like enzyme
LNGLAVAPIRDEDVEAVISLWERCGLTRPWNDPVKDIALARETPSSEILVGRLDGRVAASAMVGSDGHRAYAYYVAVDPGVQGRGLGRAIMQAAEDWAKARGCPKFHVLVRKGNEPVMGFYESLGFAADEAVLMGKRY